MKPFKSQPCFNLTFLHPTFFLLLYTCHFGYTLLKLINCLKGHHFSSCLPFCFIRLLLHSLLHLFHFFHFKMGFKVHVEWTQLATLVAVETRSTHGQIVENSVSGSLRGYRGLSRFMDCRLLQNWTDLVAIIHR